MSARCVLLLLVLCAARPVAAQSVATAVVPQGITVGDVFHAAVRIQLPPGADIQAPDSIALAEDLELAGRMEIRYDSVNGGRAATILYPLSAWRPGDYQLPTVRLRVTTDGGGSDLTVALPSFTVQSVLPQDTTGIEPRGAKDVLGANRLWWPILLALLLALLLAIALYMWWRRRRPAPEEVIEPVVPPRESALAQLDALAREGLLERGELRIFYIRLTEILRRYAATVDTRWSTHLTTSELAHQLRAFERAGDAADLVRILGSADLVKFARARGDLAAARSHLDDTRGWIERVGQVEPVAEERRAA